MDRTGSSQIEVMPSLSIRMDDVRPLIKSFFERMTVEQQGFLKQDSADNDSKVMVAELILDLIIVVSKSILATIRKMDTIMSEERLLTILGNTLPLTFAEVLDCHDQIHCVSAKHFNSMIVKEIAESVNSAISSGVDTLELVFSERVTPPHRLDIMVHHACHMLKAFMGQTKAFCTDSEKRQSTSEEGLKTKTLFATQFAKLSIHRILAQLKTTFCPEYEAESRDSTQSFAADVDSLLLTEDGEEQRDENEDVCQRFQNISDNNVLVFTKQLSDLLYNHTTNMMITETVPGVRRILVLPPRDTMYGEIQGKVWRFLGLMRWWLTTRPDIHCGGVGLTSGDTKSGSPTPAAAVSEETVPRPVQDDTAQAERNKIYVRILVQKLVSRTFHKAKVNSTFGDPNTIIERLFDKVWAEVEGVDLKITSETLLRLHKAVFKDLCKKWGSAEMVLVFMQSNEPEVENCIASTFKYHLTTTTPPKKGRAVRKFFSSLGKGISKPFTPEFRSRVRDSLQQFESTCQESLMAWSHSGGSVMFF